MGEKMVELQRQALSRESPWPGLDPFDEADRAYFHGRTIEAGELLRLVRREQLTVLFGRSGLGKTSLLKAGLFPLLRADDHLPVYLRLDHTDGAPTPREQIFHALQNACDAGAVHAARPAAGESLWSFFHRRDAEFWSERNRPVTPVIVLDQFEEIFTLESRRVASPSATFLEELGDLVENRPPDAIRQLLEAEPAAARTFDFKRANVRLVLSFREDFLAEMEGLKQRMPSLMYNRFRLLAMSGAQAYEVITRAGGHLVGDEVARCIIRLAWKNEPSPPVDPSEYPAIEIDPALLSVVCSELNHKRRDAKPPLDCITPQLLEGADREILNGFYDRGMAGLDPRVPQFVEDQLITDRGFRDSHDLEDALALPGVTSDALDALIRRRLLRVDERQGMRRLELTHDVLARVVKESRDSRRTREAEEAATARELRAREQQQRNRRNSVLVGAGAFIVLVLIVFAARSAWVARRVLREAEITRLMATADRLQDAAYDTSLLLNLEALRHSSGADPAAGLLRRFVSHPHLSTFLPGHDNRVPGVTFSRDGKWLASASLDGTAVLWDVASRKQIATLKGHQDGVIEVAFSPDGKMLASASLDHTVMLWDLASRKRIATLAGHKDGVYGVAFSPDRKVLASASLDHTVILWDVATRKPFETLQGHRDAVYSVAFSPDGKRLATASLDHSIILWDVASWKPLHKLEGHGDAVSDVTFSSDGKRLASASWDHAVRLWDVASGMPLATLEGHKDAVNGVSFSPDGRQLASASWDQNVMLWDVQSGKPLATLEGHKYGVNDVAFSPDGKSLASSGDQTVILWDVQKNKSRVTLEGHNGAVSGLAFSSDGKHLASAGWDRNVILWDAGTGKPLFTFEGHLDAVNDVAFSPDGKRLASASRDSTLILWDVGSRKPLATLAGHRDSVNDVAFSPDGKRLASGSTDSRVILWDVDSRKQIAEFDGHKGAVMGVAFSPDGARLASASADHTVMIWDVERRQRLATLDGHKKAVFSVTFSPDGKRLATAGDDKTVIVWNVETGRPIARLEGHKKAVLSVAFSPDGLQLASASADKTVILWEIQSGKPLATLEGHDDAVRSVAFSSGGDRLASASADHSIILWNLNLKSLELDACRTANRNLTCEEWRNYIGADTPYHKTCAGLPAPPGNCTQ
jgi:WD40 repeat protein